MPGEVTDARKNLDDRLTRIADDALAAIAQHPQARGGEQAIVVIRSPLPGPGDWESGMGMLGEDDDPQEQINFLLAAVQAVAQANGLQVRVVRPDGN
jgi:hypothetical protein